MAERLVDVLAKGRALLHTFPVKVRDEGPSSEEEALAKGVDAAAYAGLTSEERHHEIEARLHVHRSGSIAHPGDPLPVSAETKEFLEECVREEAYRLWEAEGRPEGRADEHWSKAYERHIRERAFRLWKHEGCPEGRADEFWQRTVNFERE